MGVYLIGVTVGCAMGYFGGKADLFGQRIVEIWSNIPFLYVVIIMVSLMPENASTTSPSIMKRTESISENCVAVNTT